MTMRNRRSMKVGDILLVIFMFGCGCALTFIGVMIMDDWFDLGYSAKGPETSGAEPHWHELLRILPLVGGGAVAAWTIRRLIRGDP